MNERIKELIAQAEVYADERYGAIDPLPNWDEYEEVWLQDYSEKLVHLVVWECAGIYSNVNDYSITGEDAYIQALSDAFWDDEE